MSLDDPEKTFDGMDVLLRLEYYHGFILKPADVEKIWSILDERFGQVCAFAQCSDGIVRPFGSTSLLLSYVNSESAAIESLVFRTPGRLAEIEFGPRAPRETIRVNVTAPANTAFDIKIRVGELVEGIRAWYNPLTWVYPAPFVLSFPIVVWIALSTLSLSRVTRIESDHAIPVGGGDVFLVIGAFIGLMGIAGFIGYLVWRNVLLRYFPVATFAWGQGQERYETSERIRWGLFVATAVSLSTGTVIAFLTR